MQRAAAQPKRRRSSQRDGCTTSAAAAAAPAHATALSRAAELSRPACPRQQLVCRAPCPRHRPFTGCRSPWGQPRPQPAPAPCGPPTTADRHRGGRDLRVVHACMPCVRGRSKLPAVSLELRAVLACCSIHAMTHDTRDAPSWSRPEARRPANTHQCLDNSASTQQLSSATVWRTRARLAPVAARADARHRRRRVQRAAWTWACEHACRRNAARCQQLRAPRLPSKRSHSLTPL